VMVAATVEPERLIFVDECGDPSASSERSVCHAEKESVEGRRT
jgi:hypothetical protein